MFINNGTLDFANKSKAIYHINLILSGINADSMIDVCGNDTQRNNATVMILVKEAKEMSLMFDL